MKRATLKPITSFVWETTIVIRDRRYLVDVWHDASLSRYWAAWVRVPNPHDKTFFGMYFATREDAIEALNAQFARSKVIIGD